MIVGKSIEFLVQEIVGTLSNWLARVRGPGTTMCSIDIKNAKSSIIHDHVQIKAKQGAKYLRN